MSEDAIPDTDPVNTEASRLTIPDPENAPEPESKPYFRPTVKNFADNEAAVKKTLDWVRGYKGDIEAQGQWDQFRKEMDIADELYRAAVDRTQLNTDESANVEDTRSKVK